MSAARSSSRRPHEAAVRRTQGWDFTEHTALLGSPPKVLWLLADNLATRQIAQVLRQQKAALQALVDDPTKSLLVLHASAP